MKLKFKAYDTIEKRYRRIVLIEFDDYNNCIHRLKLNNGKSYCGESHYNVANNNVNDRFEIYQLTDEDTYTKLTN